MTHPLNLFRYSSIFLPYIPHAVYSQLELVMDFTYSIYYFIVFMYLSGREFLYICIGVYMNTHSKAVKCLKRDSLKPFFRKNHSKNNFFETFSLLRKKTSLSLYTFASSKQGSMGERLKPAHC